MSEGKGSFYLAGLDDGWIGQPNLLAALKGTPANGPVVLLLHEPDLVDVCSRDPRIALQLWGTRMVKTCASEPRRAYALPHLGKK